ncbi:MAG TPA: L-2-hydroxyglutarate oxidase, partial [Segeticoccus sp.]|nr:L-2-hydroxyglutarate oxidase [Segeticoccus sp.]
PGSSVLVLEKEHRVAYHQTGHNSGVIHSGIYYAPGSLKAELCRRGAEATKAFCREHAIPFETPGKLLVATDGREAARMEALHERAGVNGIAVERVSARELVAMEPNVTGVGALLVHATGIVDYTRVSAAMADVVRARGGRVEYGQQATAIEESPSSVTVTASGQRYTARHLVACAGLQADRVARLAGLAPDVQIVPFRGEYYRLPAHRTGFVQRLIYPIPDPDLPFLGVHLTPMIDGSITVGPNAVLGTAREGYRKYSFAGADVREYLAFPGMWQLARHNVRTGLRELRNSVFKRGYLAAARTYAPGLQASDLLPMEAGIRAQAVRRDGSLVDDFLFLRTDRTLHVANAPSPAATSAIPIGERIAGQLLEGAARR